MKSKTEYEFCMSQFRPAIIIIALLVVVVIGWMVRDCMNRRHPLEYSLIAATTPMGPPIRVKDKALHPYWGNCSKCHQTIDAGKPVSKVMAGPPISIKQKMTHADWGNCLMCHQVTDGIQPSTTQQATAKAAAANQFSAQTLGLKTQTVTAAMMKQLGLPNEDGALVLEVAPNSIGANAGMLQGDEIIRVGKARIETVGNLDAAIAGYKPGETVQLKIYRGNKTRNIYAALPDKLLPAAATAPMTQNQVETLAEQLGVPKTQQAVTQALQQQQAKTAAATAPMTQNQVETLAEQLGVPKTQQAVTQALQQQQAKTAAATAPMTQNQVETLAEQLGVPKTQQAVTQALQRQQGKAVASAAAPPMTQNQIETLAEQLGVPKTQQAVTQALQKQNQAKTAAANIYYGKVAIASTGPGLGYSVSQQFGSSPYFIVMDPAANSYSVATNPNANRTGQDIQTGQYMVDLGVSNVVAGGFTSNAMQTLQNLRVNVYPGVTGTVQDVIGAYIAGNLVTANTAPTAIYPGGSQITGNGNLNRQVIY
jgi:predicted Fe-Mo cluster-binding NifX family protein/O6-methylguanine-DNA--protein-cysteine methyltransferase